MCKKCDSRAQTWNILYYSTVYPDHITLSNENPNDVPDTVLNTFAYKTVLNTFMYIQVTN